MSKKVLVFVSQLELYRPADDSYLFGVPPPDFALHLLSLTL